MNILFGEKNVILFVSNNVLLKETTSRLQK